MPRIVETADWVPTARDFLKEIVAEGDQWFITNHKNKIRLQVKEDGKISTRILPFDWTKKGATQALRRIEEIYRRYTALKGTKTLAKACEITEASSSKHQINWEELVNTYRQFVPNASDATWKKSYIPVLTKAGILMNRSKGKPQDGEALMMQALTQWEQGTRSRQIARRSLKGFLDWAIMRRKLIAAYAPPAQIPETKNPVEIGYAIDDQEIIELLDLIPTGRNANEEETYNSWKFAIQLCSVYGLRPEELRHLTIKKGIDGKELWTTYQKSKGGKKGNRTEPRKLHALFIKDWDGNPIDWNLQKRFSIGEKLPPLGQEGKGGEALGTFLKRRKYWKQLKEVVNSTKKEVLKPYSFRHRYAKQSHAAGFPIANIASAMGHTVEVHLQNYARFTPDATTNLYVKANEVKEA